MFRYRLEPLLRYRKTLEDQQRRRFAISNRQYLAETLLVDRLKKERTQAVARMGDKIAGIDTVGALRMYDDYLSGADIDIRQGEERAEQTSQIVEMERQKLIELVKKRRIIEAHKTRMEERYKMDEARRERAEADEIAIMRSIREAREKKS